MTPDEEAILHAADVIRARQVASPESARTAEQERYDAEIAERAERLARDPEFQAQQAENVRRAEEELRAEIARLKEAASAPIARWSRNSAEAPATPWGRCTECGSPSTEGMLYPGPSGSYLCAQHRAQHKLACDDNACSSKRGSFVSTLCGDGLYRCPNCLTPFVEQWDADLRAGTDPASRRRAVLATPGAFG